MTKGIFFTFALTLALPLAAEAQERKSPLEDAPAIRKRLELRDKRFEIGVGMGSTIGQDFYHGLMVNGRIGFHIFDWFSLAGVGAFTVLDWETSFTGKLMGSYGCKDDGTVPNGQVFQTGKGNRWTCPRVPKTDRTPAADEVMGGLNTIEWMAGLQGELVPFTGKFSLFGKLFMHYDLYAFGGAAFVSFKHEALTGEPAVQCPEGSMQSSCAVTGVKPGFNFGLGMHAFFNDFLALNLEVRDIYLRNNPAGRDTAGDVGGIADDNDLSWDSNFMVNLNLMLFLPAKAPVSH